MKILEEEIHRLSQELIRAETLKDVYKTESEVWKKRCQGADKMAMERMMLEFNSVHSDMDMTVTDEGEIKNQYTFQFARWSTKEKPGA
jgi:hypothetical protein